MDEYEKNEILKKVSSVLQFCQEIVSRLSSPSPPAPAPDIIEEIRDLANSDKAIHKELIENLIEFKDEDEEHDDDDNDLWWDSSSPPPQFYYTLVFDDDDVSLYSLDADYADFLLPSDMLEDLRMPPDKPQDVMMMTNKSRDMKMTSENVLMKSVIQFLLAATPDYVYNPNWREEYVMKWIVPELCPVWTNAEEIFEDNKPGDDDMKYVPAAIEYPTIDLHSVNSRFIENVPKPSLFPVHGVSPDPDFYHKWYDSNEPYKKIQKFRQPYPFGAEYGYETNVGVVLPSTEPVHGYIWCRGEGWKLYAVKPGDSDRTSQRSRRRA